MEKLAEDYGKLLRINNLSKELDPLSANIEAMLTRLEEFESLLQCVSLIYLLIEKS